MYYIDDKTLPARPFGKIKMWELSAFLMFRLLFSRKRLNLPTSLCFMSILLVSLQSGNYHCSVNGQETEGGQGHQCQNLMKQCGGLNYVGQQACCYGLECKYINEYWWECKCENGNCDEYQTT